MTIFKKTVIMLGLFLSIAVADPTAITNMQFTDSKGNSYDLFQLLDQGTHVYVEMVDNG